jgi:hypothetical protein
MTRLYSLPDWLEPALQSALKNLNIQLDDSRKIADCVIKMSDFYIQNPSSATPWRETWCQIAQIAYFLPLNFLRAQSVFLEAQARHFPMGESELLDFGSGLGAGSLPWIQNFHGTFVFAERSAEAQKIHQQILSALKASERKMHWISERDIRLQKNRTALFSYSMTELAKIPDWAYECDSLILIEPSTRQDGRLLLERRKELISCGFSMWAPCPHQGGCPLLEDSATDWCHDRIAIKMPEWFSKIEKFLPMRNATLTFSYLLASRNPAPARSQWRTVGDQLEEKGKTRQLVCLSPKRQFLAWMHRNGKVPEVPRGILIDPPTDFEIKSNEIRVTGPRPSK